MEIEASADGESVRTVFRFRMGFVVPVLDDVKSHPKDVHLWPNLKGIKVPVHYSKVERDLSEPVVGVRDERANQVLVEMADVGQRVLKVRDRSCGRPRQIKAVVAFRNDAT